MLARAQHGVVSVAQLRALGLGRGAIHLRVQRGRLHPLHRGVYAVGHPRLTLRGRMWAAVLAAGGVDAAALSHRTAAAVWDLLPPPAGRLELTTRGDRRSTASLHVHRSRALRASDVTREPGGLPVTTVTRTLIDLAAALPPDRLRRAVHRAEFLRCLDVAELQGAGRPRALRAILTELTATGPEMTRSELEDRFLTLIAQAGLARPKVNARIHGYEVDFLWPQHRLIAETDGAAAHLTISAFERDRRRDADLETKGFRVVRFTWRQVHEQPAAVARTLAALL